MAEEHTEQQVQVRQVTQYQASWTEGERAEPGAFTLQLILDEGVEEYVTRPTAKDLKRLLELLDLSKQTFFDLERKVLIFGTLRAE